MYTNFREVIDKEKTTTPHVWYIIGNYNINFTFNVLRTNERTDGHFNNNGECML